MRQQTFPDIEYTNRKRPTRRDKFLKLMEEIIPRDEWIAIIKPYYYKNTVGRPARGISLMLRMFLLQSWFALSDEVTEDSIYDSYAMRCFTGLDFTREQAPDATTLCKFRKILVGNGLPKNCFFR